MFQYPYPQLYSTSDEINLFYLKKKIGSDKTPHNDRYTQNYTIIGDEIENL